MNKQLFVLGSGDCPETHRLTDWLTRMGAKYEYQQALNQKTKTPLLSIDGTPRVIENATIRHAAHLLGWGSLPSKAQYDVIVIGGGPAGLSAATHAAAEGLSCLLLEAYAFGGQASSSQHVENYAGFEHGVRGDVLTQHMYRQAKRLGAELIPAMRVVGLERLATVDGWTVRLETGAVVFAQVVVIATGAQYRTIDADGISHYVNLGVFYGMTERDVKDCDGGVLVVGGGNSAAQAALAFNKLGKHVELVCRGKDLASGMSAYLIRELAQAKIPVRYSTQIAKVEGHGRLNDVILDSGEKLQCSALFVFAGQEPATDWLPEKWRNEKGYLDTSTTLQLDATCFAIGDVRASKVKRIATAAAEGAAAIAYAWQIIKGDKVNEEHSRLCVSKDAVGTASGSSSACKACRA